MAKYDIRDLLGHWVKLPPRKNQQGLCPHACCKGRRPHPDRLPVMAPRGALHDLSDEELVQRFNRPDVGENGTAVKHVLAEMERRERAREARERGFANRQTAKEARAAVRAGRADEYRAYLEHEWLAAEEQTRGVMVNRTGQARGVDPRAFWTNKALRDRYASDEMRAWFDRNPPVSSREFGSEAHQQSGARGRRSARLYGVY